jgi:hypothetical protein
VLFAFNVSGVLVNVDSPALTITRLQQIGTSSLENMVENEPIFSTGQTGVYSYTVNANNWNAGFYRFVASGIILAGQPAAGVWAYIEGQEKMIQTTSEMELVRKVRRRLKELDETLYRLDLPIRKWDDDEIYDTLLDALEEVNQTPPMLTNYNFDNCPVWYLLVQIAFTSLLESNARLEMDLTFTKSDGAANLTISRPSMYLQLASSMRSSYESKLEKFKRRLRPLLYGQGTARFPFHVRRVLGFLPNFKNIFG